MPRLFSSDMIFIRHYLIVTVAHIIPINHQQYSNSLTHISFSKYPRHGTGITLCKCIPLYHWWQDDVIKWEDFSRHWREALKIFFGWANNQELGVLRRHHAPYGVTVMQLSTFWVVLDINMPWCPRDCGLRLYIIKCSSRQVWELRRGDWT